jgi:hypothetical protein
MRDTLREVDLTHLTTSRRYSRPNGRESNKVRSTTAIVALVGTAYFALIIVALHFLRPDHDPIGQPTSAYAVGPYGHLMTSAFLSMSLATVALVIGLYQRVSPSARSRIGLGLLGAWAVGVLIAMTFPIDLPGAPRTIAGTIHRTNGPLAFLCVTAGAILVSWRFKHDEKWRSCHRPALILSMVMLAAFLGGGLSIAAETGLAGLAQRIDLAALVTWMLLTATHLRSMTSPPLP